MLLIAYRWIRLVGGWWPGCQQQQQQKGGQGAVAVVRGLRKLHHLHNGGVIMISLASLSLALSVPYHNHHPPTAGVGEVHSQLMDFLYKFIVDGRTALCTWRVVVCWPRPPIHRHPNAHGLRSVVAQCVLPSDGICSSSSSTPFRSTADHSDLGANDNEINSKEVMVVVERSKTAATRSGCWGSSTSAAINKNKWEV